MTINMTQGHKVLTGTNIIRKFEAEIITSNKMMIDPELQHWLQVREIFLTLQGEGPFAGQRAVFVRLTGCHLSCTWCDTAWDDENDRKVSIPTIVTKVKELWGDKITNPFVVLTGGEPTRQPIDFLVSQLIEKLGAHVQIETAGTFYRNCMMDIKTSVVVSPKTPTISQLVLAKAYALKYIISATDTMCPETGIPITATQPNAKPARLAVPPDWFQRERVYLSPCDNGDAIKNKANLEMAADIALRHGYTLGIQMHKIVGLD